MKRVSILLAVLVMTGITFPHAVPTLVKSAYAEEGGEKDPSAPHPDFEYVKLDPITLPVITSKGLTQQVSIVVELEVAWGKKDDIAPFEPRLIDAYLQDLYGVLGSGHALMKGDVVDIEMIKKRLTDVTTKVVGPKHQDEVHAVLLQALQQRPL
jgi:hypothetical protein